MHFNLKQIVRHQRFPLLAILVGLVMGFSVNAYIMSDRASESLKTIEDAYALINRQYVEDVNPEDLARAAIEGMLSELDPHSVFFDAREMVAQNEQFNAAFEGIGIAYELLEGSDGKDTLLVQSILPNGPSEEVGLQPGDRIVEVDGESAIGFTDEDVQKNLKGERGSQVRVTVLRPGVSEALSFTIVRDRVPIVTLDAAYMLDAETGIIRLNRFARTTYSEFLNSLRDLKGRGMQQLILDLRGNRGGYMEMAVRISDEFLKEGQLIVSQKGRAADSNEEFVATSGGLWEDRPVMVLTDGNSASASEIVAGALQDHDRGLIVGQRTFGKGLVQKQYYVNDGSVVRLTVARYFTPTGRLIQTPYEDGDRADYYSGKAQLRQSDGAKNTIDLLSDIPDSLVYHTDSGRPVLAGGGIIPDFMVAADTLSPLMRAVLGPGLENSFIRSWVDKYGASLKSEWGDEPAAFVSGFVVDTQMMDQFLEYSAEQGVVISGTQIPKNLDAEEVTSFTREEFEAEKKMLEALLKGRLGSRLYDRSIWYQVWGNVDHVLLESRQLWLPASELAADYAGVH